MSTAWNYLNSAELVFKVQRYFGIEKVEGNDKQKWRATNSFFHYLFLLGTELGDELFYGLFIPLFFFNIDSYIGRRFIFHWFVNMYVGQALKEVFKEVRPKAPAIPLQTKWSNEFSLPSTHAMGSLSMAATILYFALDRYEVSLFLGIICVVLWVAVISLSRVYLGMHSVLDLVLGVVITFALLILTLPETDAIMDFLAINSISPILIVLVPVILIVYFPTTEMWTPTRGDTCTIAAVFSGIELGNWMNHQLGLLSLIDIPNPRSLEYGGFYNLAVRTIIGLFIAGLTEYLMKLVSFSLLSRFVGEDRKKLKASENSVENVKKNFVDLTSKFVTYFLLGFNLMLLVPTIQKYFNVHREAFFSEM